MAPGNIIMENGHGVVHVSTGGNLKPAMDSSVGTKEKEQMERAKVELGNLTAHLAKIHATMAPWKVSKYAERMDTSVGELKESLGGAIDCAVKYQLANLKLQGQVEGKQKELEASQRVAASLTATLAERDAELAALRCAQANEESRVKALLTRIDTTKASAADGSETSPLNKSMSAKGQAWKASSVSYKAKEAREAKAKADAEAASAAAGLTRDEQIVQLQERVESLMAEHAELQDQHDKLSKSKAELAKKHAELQTKYSNTADVAERELRRLTGEIKRLGEAKDKEVAAAREASEKELTSKLKDARSLQKRYDSMKEAVEAAKDGHKGLAKQLEETAAALAKAQADVEAARARAGMADAGREALSREVEMLKVEQGMLLADTTDARAAQLAQEVRKGSACAAPFPRHAFTTKHGRCLHNHACNAYMDASVMSQPVAYDSHVELQQHVEEHGLFLCRACKTKPGF